MIEWTELEELLQAKGFSASAQKSVKDLLASLPFTKRQQILGIMVGFPEKLSLFVDLITKKRELKHSKDEALLEEILVLEEKEVSSAIQALS